MTVVTSEIITTDPVIQVRNLQVNNHTLYLCIRFSNASSQSAGKQTHSLYLYPIQ